MKKYLLILLGFILLWGCSAKKQEGIVVWHWMLDRHDAVCELAKQYEAKTGIKVEFKKFFPPEVYSQKVIAAAQAGTLPEIFGILGEKKILASFVSAGYVEELSSVTQSAKENPLVKQAVATSEFEQNNSYKVKPGVYGIPIDSMNIQFMYNKKLFQDAGLAKNAPPETFAEFIEAAKLIKANNPNVEGFVCGWGEVWLLHSLCTEWAINLMGEDKFFKTIKGEVPYNDPQWIEVFGLFKKLKDEGVLYSDIVSMINKEAEDAFSREKAVFSFDGSWAVNVHNQLAPDLDYGFFPLPAVSLDNPVKIWGGAGASFMVNSKSAYKQEALDFLAWLIQKDQQLYLVQHTNNLPSIYGLEESLDEKLSNLSDDLDKITHPNIWPYEEDSRVIEAMDRGIQQIILGAKTPKEAADETQQVKQQRK